jgi:site-specific recombinase XerD
VIQRTGTDDECTAFLVVPLERELFQVRTELAAHLILTAQTARRMSEIFGHFTGFVMRAHGVSSLGEVRSEHTLAFIEAPVGSGDEPSPATMHLRRSAIRLLFRVARTLALCGHDPTLDAALPPRSSSKLRPLSDDEVALCRSHSLETLQETRQPAAWALAEATATTTELSHARLSDLNLDCERVWLRGGRSTTPRWGYLSPWGLGQLTRRARVLRRRSSTDPLVAYEGKGSEESRTASACIAISETLRRAGLSSEPDIRPSSVRAWAGAQILRDTDSIEEVARRLGMRSLDRAARFIGHGWNLELETVD